MHRWVTVPIIVALLLASCGDDPDEPTSAGQGDPGTTEADPSDVEGAIDAEVLALAPGEPSTRNERGVVVLDPSDPSAAAALFAEDERDDVATAVSEADLDGRTLLGGIVHVGCTMASAVFVVVQDEEVHLRPEDMSDREGDIQCVAPSVTSALVAVGTDDLPEAYREEGPGAGGDGGEVPGEVVLVAPTGYEPAAQAGPGLVRDAVDVDALVGRYEVEHESEALRSRVETGEEVLVAGVVGEECDPPVAGRVVRSGDDLDLLPEHGGSDQDPEPDIVCDALAQALVVVAVDADAVEGVATVRGAPADGPVGVGQVQVVQAVDVEAAPLAVVSDDEGGVAAVLSRVPGAPPLDLPPVEADAVRLVFVVEGCQPGTGELIADLGAGTVRAEVQQVGPPVECEALAPHVVIADLAGDHADLEPVTD